MLIQIKTPVALKIERPEDLPRLKEFMEENKIKVNKSDIARQLKLDRRTVSKYLEGYEKSKTRNKPSKMDEQYELIKELLSSEIQRFSYRIDLYRYMQDNHGSTGCSCYRSNRMDIGTNGVEVKNGIL